MDIKQILEDHAKWINSEVGGVRANLGGADLREADLRRAYLGGADLRRANLGGAYLGGANLRGAYLGGANLRGADLRGARISRSVGDSEYIKSMSITKWVIVYTESDMAIGCEQHSIEKWKNFTDDDIRSMDSDALEFWNKYKNSIFMIIDTFKD